LRMQNEWVNGNGGHHRCVDWGWQNGPNLIFYVLYVFAQCLRKTVLIRTNAANKLIEDKVTPEKQ